MVVLRCREDSEAIEHSRYAEHVTILLDQAQARGQIVVRGAELALGGGCAAHRGQSVGHPERVITTLHVRERLFADELGRVVLSEFVDDSRQSKVCIAEMCARAPVTKLLDPEDALLE
jgi:hypothetical protein